MANLGWEPSDRTVGNILRRNGIAPTPKRNNGPTWKEFIDSHKEVTVGADFFTSEVITPQGLMTYYILLLIDHQTRRICIAGATPHPHSQWMQQMARNLTMADEGFLNGKKYIIHYRDSIFCEAFDKITKGAGTQYVRIPARSPNLNAFTEPVIRSFKEECLSRVIPFGEMALWNLLRKYTHHFHVERNHQGLKNKIPFPLRDNKVGCKTGKIRCRSQLGGLLKYYYRSA